MLWKADISLIWEIHERWGDLFIYLTFKNRLLEVSILLRNRLKDRVAFGQVFKMKTMHLCKLHTESEIYHSIIQKWIFATSPKNRKKY